MRGKSGEGEVGREGERGDNVSLIVYCTCLVEALLPTISTNTLVR